VNVIQNSGEHMGGAGKPPEIPASNGVDVIICSNLAQKQ